MTLPAPVHAYPTNIPALTSLRFFAAFIVVLNHLGYYFPFDIKTYTMFMKNGALAVDFFFMLSGFILTHTYGDGLLNKKISYRHFMIRRFARLYPVHILTLLAMTGSALVGIGFGYVAGAFSPFPWSAFLHQVLLIHAWGIDHALYFNAPSWSISAEWFAYLIFPLLVPWLMRTDPRLLLPVAVFILVGLWTGAHDLHLGRAITRRTFDWAEWRILPEFIIGCALYRFGQRIQPWRNPARILIGCAIVLTLAFHFNGPDLFALAVFAVAILAAADINRLGVSSWLNNATMTLLGEASYAMYMIHYVLIVYLLDGTIQILGKVFYTRYYPLLFMAVIVLTVSLSILIFKRFETPWRRRIQSWDSKKTRV